MGGWGEKEKGMEIRKGEKKEEKKEKGMERRKRVKEKKKKKERRSENNGERKRRAQKIKIKTRIFLSQLSLALILKGRKSEKKNRSWKEKPPQFDGISPLPPKLKSVF